MITSESVAEHVYPRLPVFLQNAACWYYGTKESRQRFGKLFDRHLNSLLESEKWSASEIEAYQDEKLRGPDSLRLRERSLLPSTLAEFENHSRAIFGRARICRNLPVLTKEDVVQNRQHLLSSTASRSELAFKHTSGTTGKALQFYVSKAIDRVSVGRLVASSPALWTCNRGAGMRTLPANASSLCSSNRRRYWRWNRPMRQALINMQHITPAKIGSIMEFLNSNHFRVLFRISFDYPPVATTAQRAGLTLTSRPRVIATGAENMLDFQRRDIAEFTGAILTDQYGCSEGCGNASHCPESRLP